MYCQCVCVSGPSQSINSARDEGDINWQEFAIDGTSQALEKPYLRLTSVSDLGSSKWVHQPFPPLLFSSPPTYMCHSGS